MVLHAGLRGRRRPPPARRRSRREGKGRLDELRPRRTNSRRAAFTPDGSRIATGSYDTSCRLWRVPDLVPLGMSLEQRGHVWDIAFNPAGTLLAAAADDNTARVKGMC